MPQFFIDSNRIHDDCFAIRGEDYHHLTRVRRVTKDDIISVRTESGELLSAKIINITEHALLCVIIEKQSKLQAAVCVTLYLSVLKGKNFDLAIQKAVEVGVTRIVPVISERTIPKIEAKETAKIARWNKIAIEAAKQCMREHVPTVSEVTAFSEALHAPESLRLLAHTAVEKKRDVFQGSLDCFEAAVLIGPEGGFSHRELEQANAAGWEAFNFGTTQLRAETAAIVIPALVIYELMKRTEA